MKPESHLAFAQLKSFGMEELSSEEAARLLARIDECPECHGEWVLFYETICTLSQTHLDDPPADCSKKMWLVCLEHAKEKHTFSITDPHDEGDAAHQDATHHDAKQPVFAGRNHQI